MAEDTNNPCWAVVHVIHRRKSSHVLGSEVRQIPLMDAAERDSVHPAALASWSAAVPDPGFATAVDLDWPMEEHGCMATFAGMSARHKSKVSAAVPVAALSAPLVKLSSPPPLRRSACL